MQPKFPTKKYASLILGTAQLGQVYGIANRAGQPNQSESDAIVRAAVLGGIHMFDTAQAYGNSELVLGRSLRNCDAMGIARIITKLPPDLPSSLSSLRAAIEGSLVRLGVERLHCLMLHREEHLSLLNGWHGEVLQEYKCNKVVNHVGVSVYTPEAALRALINPTVSVVQIPSSLFDRRFESAGVFTVARNLNKEVHIRSVFLQGILGMSSQCLPDNLRDLAPAISELERVCIQSGFSKIQLALCWILQRFPETYVLFGAEQVVQVMQNLDFAAQTASIIQEVYKQLDHIFPPQRSELLNPALWKQKL